MPQSEEDDGREYPPYYKVEQWRVLLRQSLSKLDVSALVRALRLNQTVNELRVVYLGGLEVFLTNGEVNNIVLDKHFRHLALVDIAYERCIIGVLSRRLPEVRVDEDV